MSSSVQGIKTVLHPVSDVEKAKAVYAALLGVEPHTTRRTTSASTSPASTSGCFPAVARRASRRLSRTGTSTTSRRRLPP